MKEYHYIRERQPGIELYTFVMPAEDLLAYAQIDRFNQAEEGVERELNLTQVQKLVEFMRQSDASFAEPILGDLRGHWQLDKTRQIFTAPPDSKLLIDDGQHRIGGLHYLSPEERKKWEFKVTATINTPYRERLRRFLQQLKRLKLDSQLVWQIQDRGDLFPDQGSKATYQIAKRLASESDSPLCGLIRLTERAPKPLVGNDVEVLRPLLGNLGPTASLRESTTGTINVGGILRDLRLAISSTHSVLRIHNQEQQYRIVVALLDTARALWPEAWKDPKRFFLRRAVGIGALIQLFAVGRIFKDSLRKPLKDSLLVLKPETKDEIVKTLAMTKKYDWSFERFRRPGMRFPQSGEVARELDALIYQRWPRSEFDGDRKVRTGR